jgi:hypothetical protein
MNAPRQFHFRVHDVEIKDLPKSKLSIVGQSRLKPFIRFLFGVGALPPIYTLQSTYDVRDSRCAHVGVVMAMCG